MFENRAVLCHILCGCPTSRFKELLYQRKAIYQVLCDNTSIAAQLLVPRFPQGTTLTTTFTTFNGLSGTLMVVTWDEDNYTEENMIDTYMLVAPGTQDGHMYNHYSLLRTVEHNWDIGSLQTGRTTSNSLEEKYKFNVGQ